MTDFGWSYPAGCNSVPADEEDCTWVGELEADIRKLNEGRNLRCWPLCSFGWKDADLDPGGCTGISKVVGVTEEAVTVEVGGHKTLSYDSEASEDEQLIQWEAWLMSIPTGVNVDGDVDGLSLSFSDNVTVETPDDFWDSDTAIKDLAERIVEAARKRCKVFEDAIARM